MSRAPDTGIFNPASNGGLTRENKHVGAVLGAECAANGMPAGGFTRYPWTAEELRALAGEPGPLSRATGPLHPVAAAYLASNAGYGSRGRQWEGAR